MIKASMLSIGAYIPEFELSNIDLEKMVDTSNDWIIKRTGIKSRRIAKGENTSDLGYKAALCAIKRANIDKNDIDALLCATISPDYYCMPSTACKIANMLELKSDVLALDISAACSGFIYLLELARSLIESGIKKNVLIIGAEKLSSIINWKDRNTCVLFGDGAGASIIGATKSDFNIIDTHTASDGSKGDLLITPAPGSVNPISHKIIDENLCYMQMSGNEVFKVAVNTLTNDVINILEKNMIKSEDIDLFIPHQANIRIIDAVKNKLGLKDSQCIVTVDKFGNTSSASIPMAINDAFENKRLKKGDLMLLDAFGGGFTWGSALLRFNGENL